MSHIGTKFVIAQRFVFDPNSNTLLDQDFSNEIVRLGSNESRILLMLAERPNEVISRNELHEFVWREQGFEVDDSSLTQAISTLRKMLKDSTKSPEFVKTVPKRGYQLICSVERINPLLSDKPSSSEDAPVAEVSNNDVAEFTPDDNEHALLEAETHHPKEPRTAPKTRWYIIAMWVLSVLLPISVILFTNPAESRFRVLANIGTIQVLTPINHPPLQAWLPSIEQCVHKYSQVHSGESTPVKVIATGGQNNQLTLNYIHNLNHSGENITLRIVADQNDLGSICK
ncbi:transcriptional regulator [Vibrio cidicii]|uniref:transcriptional regulator n=1 Tax=Vibrio cidicii TaxID=1763883 RepID=UPI0018C34276|nr:transcriptional regulator [Vibrio cidicii]MBG0757017.1 transcriptional regulator [Vibrio cidicii]MBG0758195.1 transcriptional regulator [Vibrio cidicii]